APCISHGIRSGMGTSIAEERKAVDSGHCHLYRYNPDLWKEGKNPLILDSQKPETPYRAFLTGEVRYTPPMNLYPELAEKLFEESETHARERYETYLRLAGQ